MELCTWSYESLLLSKLNIHFKKKINVFSPYPSLRGRCSKRKGKVILGAWEALSAREVTDPNSLSLPFQMPAMQDTLTRPSPNVSLSKCKLTEWNIKQLNFDWRGGGGVQIVFFISFFISLLLYS